MSGRARDDQVQNAGLAEVAVDGGPSRTVAFVESRVFGCLWSPKTLDEFVSLAQNHALGPSHLSGWRGQADIGWPLHSTALRRLRADTSAVAWGTIPNESGDDDEDLLSEYEARLLERGRSAGHGHREGRRLSDLELLALLQHHGAATRLVDWTANALIALWFACRSNHDRHGVVLGVCLDDVWRVTTEEHRERSLSELLVEAEERMTYFQPPPLSPRIMAQGGFFLWSRVQHREWSSLGTLSADADGGISVLSQEFLAIAIPPALKEHMRERWLDLLGYADHTLFPDFDGFANAHGVDSQLPWDFFVDPR